MAKKENSLAHTKWMCKYHIVFTPKYRRKVIYNQYKEDIRDIIKQLCGYKMCIRDRWRTGHESYPVPDHGILLLPEDSSGHFAW